MKPQALTLDIEETLGGLLNADVSIRAWSPVSGGSINEAFKIDTNFGPFFIKLNRANMHPGMFQMESAGLFLLRSTECIKVPEVLAVGECEGQAYLIQEFLEPGIESPTFWENFGEAIAELHSFESDQFGLDHSNYIGSLIQHNQAAETWAEFFTTQRLQPQVKMAVDKGKMPLEVQAHFDRLYPQLDSIFPDEEPALLHGDLWNGNFSIDAEGKPCIFDPAVYFGCREMDIGMTLLFGGYNKTFYDAYINHTPLIHGWQERVDLCNLYPLLVHLNLFGGSYLDSVHRIVDKF